MDKLSYHIVRTGDGSSTLYLPSYDEHMHSLSGAYEEALLKHVYPSGIASVQKAEVRVLDVGFGLGYNILALIMERSRRNAGGRLEIISFEKDRTLLPALECIEFHDERDPVYSSVRRAYREGSHGDAAVRITVLFGDARNSIRNGVVSGFDAVFFDPFSPAKNPELWSVDFFKEIHARMGNAGILTTYSSAPQVRMAMVEAGFIIGRGPSVGGKKEGTLAAKSGIIVPFDDAEMLSLRGSFRSIPYRDPELNSSGEIILLRRRDEMRKRGAQHTAPQQ